MNDLEYLIILFNKNKVDYRITEMYDDSNERCGQAMWLNVGHIEFNNEGMLINIVTY